MPDNDQEGHRFHLESLLRGRLNHICYKLYIKYLNNHAY